LNGNGTIGAAAPPAGAGTTTESIHGIGANDSFVFAANLVNNAMTDSISDAIEFDRDVSADAALAGAHAGETAAEGVHAADAVNAATVSNTTFAEFNNHGFHLV